MAKLLLLGPAREAAGRRHDEIEGSSVGEILAAAVARYGTTFGEVLSRSQVWLNGEPTDESVSVGAHDEVAVIPPVSGG